MMNWMRTNNMVVALSTVSLLVFLERIFLDFRYVAVEMEAPLDFMPFTLPYMVAAFVVIGGWMWALLAAKESPGALIALLVFNALGLFFSVSTMTTLCPLPCGTAWPVSDTLIVLELIISGAAFVTAGAAWWGRRP